MKVSLVMVRRTEWGYDNDKGGRRKEGMRRLLRERRC